LSRLLLLYFLEFGVGALVEEQLLEAQLISKWMNLISIYQSSW